MNQRRRSDKIRNIPKPRNELLILTMENLTVKQFVERLNDRLIELNPMARVDGVKIKIHGEVVDTEIKLVPIGPISSAEEWDKLSRSVELEITGFAKLFLEESKGGQERGKGKVRRALEQKMERGRESFAKALKGDVPFIDPEDVTG